MIKQKVLNNYSDWSGQFYEYEVFGVSVKGIEEITEQFVGSIRVGNSGEAFTNEGKCLSLIDTKKFNSAYYIFRRPNPMGKEEIITDKVNIFNNTVLNLKT
jgi:hypothetical protein